MQMPSVVQHTGRLWPCHQYFPNVHHHVKDRIKNKNVNCHFEFRLIQIGTEHVLAAPLGPSFDVGQLNLLIDVWNLTKKGL